MECSSPGSSVHGIFQSRILEWVAISYSRGSSQPRDQTHISRVSCIVRWVLYHWATWEALLSSHVVGSIARLGPPSVSQDNLVSGESEFSGSNSHLRNQLLEYLLLWSSSASASLYGKVNAVKKSYELGIQRPWFQAALSQLIWGKSYYFPLWGLTWRMRDCTRWMARLFWSLSLWNFVVCYFHFQCIIAFLVEQTASLAQGLLAPGPLVTPVSAGFWLGPADGVTTADEEERAVGVYSPSLLHCLPEILIALFCYNSGNSQLGLP